jgi:hypothetical protein
MASVEADLDRSAMWVTVLGYRPPSPPVFRRSVESPIASLDRRGPRLRPSFFVHFARACVGRRLPVREARPFSVGRLTLQNAKGSRRGAATQWTRPSRGAEQPQFLFVGHVAPISRAPDHTGRNMSSAIDNTQ